MDDRPDYLMVDLTVFARRDSGTGIQRMVRSVWRELRAFPLVDMQVVPVAVFPDLGYCYLDWEARNTPDLSGTTLRRCNPRQGDVFLGLDLNVDGLPLARAQVEQWRAVGVPIWLTVYDLIPITHPRWFTWRYARRFKKWFDIGNRIADGFIAISDHVGHQVRTHMVTARGIRHDRPAVCTVTPGADFLAHVGSAPPDIPASLLNRSFVLMVGTVEPRKGYDFALKIFERMWRGDNSEPAVVIVGKPGWQTRGVQRKLNAHRTAGASLFWLENADDSQLGWLYDNAGLLLAASLDEGFGLPISEALSRSLPVLANDIPPFREFNSSNIEFMTYNDVEGAVRQVRAMMGKERIASHPPCQRPEWRETAMEILEHMGLVARIDG